MLLAESQMLVREVKKKALVRWFTCKKVHEHHRKYKSWDSILPFGMIGMV